MKISLKTQLGKGEYEVLFDDEHVMLLFNYRWHVAKRSRNCMYAVARDSGGKAVYMHHLILPPSEGKMIDHVNGNGLDNRLRNLRLCRKIDNQRNQRPKCGKQFKGIYYRAGLKKPWVAHIRVHARTIHLGYHATEIEAAEAYNLGAEKYFGDFAWFNKVGKWSDT